MTAPVAATPPPLPQLAVEYVPTREHVLHARRFMFRRTLLNPPVVMIFSGSLLICAGGLMMGLAGSYVWLALAVLGLLFFILLAAVFVRLAPTPATVEKEFATRAWLRTPAHVQLTEDALIYDHGSLSARVTWPGIRRIIETDRALIVIERNAPGAMYYPLPRSELDRSGGGSREWREYLAGRVAR